MPERRVRIDPVAHVFILQRGKVIRRRALPVRRANQNFRDTQFIRQRLKVTKGERHIRVQSRLPGEFKRALLVCGNLHRKQIVVVVRPRMKRHADLLQIAAARHALGFSVGTLQRGQ